MPATLTYPPSVNSLFESKDLTSLALGDPSKLKDAKDLVQFRVIWNDGRPEHMVALICAKNIFAAQLPKMPKEYIARLVLDRSHRTMCIISPKGVIGAICFRPFFSQGFAEIVFCAVTSSEHVKGYGTRIMNHLKEHVKTEGIYYFLTYADNYATGYFRKQGFTKNLTLPPERWKGWIKDYDGGTLMECKINSRVNYLDIPGTIAAQREAVYARIKQISNTHSVYPGLDFSRRKSYSIEEIPGVLEAGWTSPKKKVKTEEPQRSPELIELQARLAAVLRGIQSMKDSWPFKDAVDRNVVPDYYTVITEPMHLREMERRLNSYYYTSRELFERDFALIVNNCRQYNDKSTSYYKCACVIEEAYHKLMALHFPATAEPSATASDGSQAKQDAGSSGTSSSSAGGSGNASGVKLEPSPDSKMED